MSMNDPYAPVTVWDTYHAALVTEVEELNPQGWWVPGLLPFLLTAGAQSVLDVGCGTGGDAVSLAQQGLHVTAMDYSQIALARAQAKAAAADVVVDFRQGDMALPFPFADEGFDAVMSNVAFHSQNAFATSWHCRGHQCGACGSMARWR
jgi:SAM-dependent methyltransferase